MKKMRAKVKEITAPRSRLYWSPKQMVNKLNPIIQGWKNYYGSVDPWTSNRFLSKVDWHIIRRLTLYWNKETQTKSPSSWRGQGDIRAFGIEAS